MRLKSFPRTLKRYALQPRVAGGVISVFGVLWLFSLLPHLEVLDVLDPVEQLVQDFDITDLVFSRGRTDADMEVEPEVVIVNIGNLPRAGIAEELRRIEQHQPRVIGVDCLFLNEETPEEDSALIHVLQTYDNIVLAEHLEFAPDPSELKVVGVRRPAPVFRAATGFANQNSEAESFRTVRTFRPRIQQGDSTFEALSVAVVRKYDPKLLDRLYARGNEEERVNYRGNIFMNYHLQTASPEMLARKQQVKFTFLDVDAVLDPAFAEQRFLKDKIVLLGFVDPTGSQSVDMFFTPLNPQYVGRAYPDMYGVVVHANIISMLLHGNYIDVMPSWAAILIAILVTYLNVIFFAYVHDRYETWFEVFARLMQLVQLIVCLLLILYLFYNFDYEININLLIASVFLTGDVLEVYLDVLRIKHHPAPSALNHSDTNTHDEPQHESDPKPSQTGAADGAS